MAVSTPGRPKKSIRDKNKSSEYKRLVSTTHKGNSLGFSRDMARASS